MDYDKLFYIYEGDSPLVAAAIHCGHNVRKEVAENLVLPETERLREEDPFTDEWTTIADTRIIVQRSRFEVDLNRPRSKAVYLKPEHAWGLQLWKSIPATKIVDESLVEYDAFYTELRRFFSNLKERFRRFVVFDLHSYNHRRKGRECPPADDKMNPEVNIGTGTMERFRWSSLVDRFIADLHDFSFLGRHLDVRENVKFLGGQFAHWIHCNFPESACVLSIEFKKFFMDEWTGEPDRKQLEAIGSALQSTVPGIFEELRN